jgi:hypothetical protein
MYSKDELVFLTQEHRENPNYLIIGSAVNGPVQTIFQLKDDTDPYQVLGTCPMAYGVVRARDNGVNPLLFRLNGSHGELTIVHEQSKLTCLTLRTIEAKSACNDIYFHCYPTHMVVRGLNQERIFMFSNYATIQELASAINLLMWYEGFELEAVAVQPELNPATMILVEKTYYMQGASSQFPISTDQSLALLRDTLVTEEGMNYNSDLLDYKLDTIAYSDILYETAPQDLVSIFGQFSSLYTEHNGYYVATVLSTIHPPSTYHPKENVFNINPEWLKHILIVDGEEIATTFREQTMPIGLNYAALRFKTPYTTSNVPFPENTILANEHKKVKVAELVGRGYICTVTTRKGVVVPFLEQNIYPSSSYLSKSYLLRSAYHDISLFSNFFIDYLGEDFSISKRDIIQQSMNTFCEELKKKPHYRDVTASFVQVERDRIEVTIQIVFFSEIGSMSVTTSYSKQ